MSLFLYNIFLLLFRAGTRITSFFNPKAKKWVSGRNGIFKKLQEAIPSGEKIIWIHCASLGEFEQGRPVIEKIRERYSAHRILLTFFSPSGYEPQKNYQGADWVFYLPMDGPRNAKRFLDIVNPSLVVFVKYEFWYYYLKKIKYRNIPLLLISALFRNDMSFFKWYGALQRKILSRFNHLFVQNESSKKLLDDIGLAEITSISGDTRFDRVIEIAEQWQSIQTVEKFIGSAKTIVAGSTWPEDEEVLQKAFAAINNPLLKIIIAPHEVNEKNLLSIKELFPHSIKFSQLSAHPPVENGALPINCLIVDNIGMLSRLYKYGDIAYIGGGLKPMGVHNVLEAAVYGKPVVFGAYYKKYAEATELVSCKGAIPFVNENELKIILMQLLEDGQYYKDSAFAASQFVKKHAGATQKIMDYIQENRLLTN